ncbi:TonB-dependent receptor [Herbaspirillum lusitanum]|uniref:TonB-dependent receptor n=1 Tax=Herbaspirillum lusitanum TaxID=213312 RepID=A0ABW9AFI7_9BURK
MSSVAIAQITERQAGLPALSAISRAVIVACLSIGTISISGVVHAQPVQPVNAALKSYRISAGTLDQALNAFGAQAGILIWIDANRTQGKTSGGLNGQYSVEGGLAALLAGSGLQAVKSDNGGYVLQEAPATNTAASDGTLPTVEVSAEAESGENNAYRSRSMKLGALGTSSLRNTPYSVDVITRELIENKQAHSLSDAVKGDAGIASGSNYTNGTGDVLLIRGTLLSYRNNYKLDGMDLIGFLGAPQLPTEVMENIEVLKGAGGFLYGFGTPGGIVSLTLKRPTNEPVRTLNTQITDSGKVLVHGDVGGRFGEDDRFGYRINLVKEQGDTYVKDGGKIDRQTVSLAFDWRLTRDLVWSLDALHQERRVDAVYYQLVPNASGGLSNAISAPPAAVDGSKRLASPFAYSQIRSTSVGTSLAWQFAQDWNARVSYRKWDQDMQSDHSFLYANAAGTYTEMQISLPSKVRSEQTQAMLTGSFGGDYLRNDVTLGVTYSDIQAQESNDFKSAVLGTGVLGTTTNYANPGLSTTWIDGGWYFPEQQKSAFISDIMHVGTQVDLIAGLRHSSFKSTTYDKSAVTPTVAMVYRPVTWLSTYASYVEALEQGSVAPTGTVNANEVFAPLKSKQGEIGVKTELGNWSASAALFRMNQALTYTTSAGVYTQDGQARYQGLELSSKLRVDRRWNILASAVFLDARNTKTSGGTLDGKRTPGASRQQYSLYSEYSLADMPATFTGGVRYVSARVLDTNNNWELPGYTVWDLGARYVTRLGQTKTTFRLNLDNIANKAYWLMAGSNRLIQGAPRTINLSAQFDF